MKNASKVLSLVFVLGAMSLSAQSINKDKVKGYEKNADKTKNDIENKLDKETTAKVKGYKKSTGKIKAKGINKERSAEFLKKKEQFKQAKTAHKAKKALMKGDVKELRTLLKSEKEDTTVDVAKKLALAEEIKAQRDELLIGMKFKEEKLASMKARIARVEKKIAENLKNLSPEKITEAKGLLEKANTRIAKYGNNITKEKTRLNGLDKLLNRATK